MTKSIWLVTKDMSLSNRRCVNGITGVVGNFDSAQTAAQVRVAAATRLIGAGHKMKSNYFTAAVQIFDLIAGPIKDDLDLYAFGGTSTPVAVIEGP